MSTLLILGGTAQARRLADSLAEQPFTVVSSLAGRTSSARLPAGEVISGGFGGASGLAAFLKERSIAAVVNATHPFSTQMSNNAVIACQEAKVPLLRFTRPSWREHSGAASWTWVADHQQAATVAANRADGGVVALTVGRQELPAYVESLRQHQVLARVTELTDDIAVQLPNRWQIIENKGPFSADDEREFLQGTSVMVTKDSGGCETAAKLTVADELGIPVIVVSRPQSPAEVATVTTSAQAMQWVLQQLS
ncbi:MAG: cobalt-precorrin-6A reductase [Propionibacteriaceae bacterium]